MRSLEFWLIPETAHSLTMLVAVLLARHATGADGSNTWICIMPGTYLTAIQQRIRVEIVFSQSILREHQALAVTASPEKAPYSMDAGFRVGR
jgi:hypothetical protein